MALSGNFWGGVAQSAPTQPAAKSSGGIGGFLFNNIVKPAASVVTDIPGDLFHGGKAIGDIVGTVVSRHHGAQFQADKQKALNEIQQSPSYGQFFAGNVKQNQAKSTSSQLEKIAGKAASNVLNVAAPGAGVETLAGKGALQVIGKGIGLGAKFGAAGGAANAAAQGDSGGDVINNALAGAGTGALVGGAGGALSATLGSRLGRSIASGGKKLGSGVVEGATGRTANPSAGKPNIFDRAATANAQNEYATKVQDQFGNGGKLEASTGTPINALLAEMKQHGINPTVEDMARFGHAGYAYHDIQNGLVDNHGKSAPLDVASIIKNSFSGQPGLGDPMVKGSDANKIAQGLRSTLTESLNKDGSHIDNVYHPAELLTAAQDLRVAKPQNSAEGAVFANARRNLIAAAGEHGVNKGIEDYNLPSVADHQAGISPNGDVAHILKATGGNDSLAQKIVDNLNAAKTIPDIQQAEIPHIAANELAGSHAQAIGKTLPQPEGKSYSTTGSPSGNYYAARELGGALSGNPIAALPLVARAGTGSLNKLIGKVGNADKTKVGPRAIPDVSAAAPVTPPHPSGPIMVDDHSASNVLGRLMGGVKRSNLLGAATAVGATNIEPNAVNAQKSDDLITEPSLALDDTTSTSDTDSAPTSSTIFSPQVLQALAIRDLEETGGKNLAQISTLATLFGQNGSQSSTPKLSATQQSKADAVQNAAGSIKILQQQFADAGGSSPFAEAESKIPVAGSRLQPKLAAYNATRYDAASALAAATVGGKPTASSIKYWENSLPSANDSAEAAQAKIDNVMQQLVQRGKIYGLTAADLNQ